MGFLGKAMRSGIAAKAAQVAMREAKKPENRQKARELVQKLRGKRRPGS